MQNVTGHCGWKYATVLLPVTVQMPSSLQNSLTVRLDSKFIQVVKDPTTPRVCCYTTLWNIWHLFNRVASGLFCCATLQSSNVVRCIDFLANVHAVDVVSNCKHVWRPSVIRNLHLAISVTIILSRSDVADGLSLVVEEIFVGCWSTVLYRPGALPDVNSVEHWWQHSYHVEGMNTESLVFIGDFLL